MTTMMKCGHSANATTSIGFPCCAICLGTTPDAKLIDAEPDLTGRKAHCNYGKHAITDSSTNLAFFEHKPNSEFDIYYCGCFGWD